MARGATSREKILQAAATLAFSEGAAHMSLDAVAARAGVSKGGLLYNFPNKSALMRALVEQFIDRFRADLGELSGAGATGDELAILYQDLVIREMGEKASHASGLLAALAEDPCLLEPLKQFNRELVDEMTHDARDRGAVLILFLVLEGLRAQQALGVEVLDEEERTIVLNKVRSLVSSDGT